MITIEREYHRFLQQAGWTQAVRRFVYQHTGLRQARRVLEVGCGPGVILADLQANSPAAVYGLDQRMEALVYARSVCQSGLTNGDGLTLPYAGRVFDFTCCHFTLLWVGDPLRVLLEMRRVTRVGGWVAVLAEPDYGGRIDYPEGLVDLGKMQTVALKERGADPCFGRKLMAHLQRCGLQEVRVGVINGMWNQPPETHEWAMEWEMLEEDLDGKIKPESLDALRSLDWESCQAGERILYVPTFYGWGRVID